MRTHLRDALGLAVAAALLVGLVLVDQRRREAAADRAFDRISASALDDADRWLGEFLVFQRAVAFMEPDERALGAALEPSVVAFSLALDGSGRVRATFPPRPDIVVGNDLSGRFPHIDAVLGGEEVAFWASDASTTRSGRVAAVAVAGPGTPPSVLTVAFDLADTGLLASLDATLAPLDAAAWRIVDDRTGVVLAGIDDLSDVRVRSRSVSGWTVSVGAPTESAGALVGGTTNVPLRAGALLAFVLAGVVVLVNRRRRDAADAHGLGRVDVFRAALTPAMVVDSTTNTVVRANDAMRLAVLGEQRSLAGRPVSDVLVPEPGMLLDHVDGSGRDGWFWADGEQRRCRIRTRELVAIGGAPGSLLVEVEDVDDERRRTEALERQKVSLQDLAGRLSHDLRTPLASITGFADLLVSRPEASSADRAEWAGRIARNAHTLADYIGDMATAADDVASKPATGVLACVHRAVRLNEAHLRQVGGEIEVDIADDLEVGMPELLLRQIVHNLVDNAVKYRNRAVALRVVVSARILAGERLELIVADNGPGISPHLRDTVFAPGERTASAKIAGSGLGLAMCRTLATDVGGTLVVRDGEPTGAEFVLTLPATTRLTSAHPEIDVRHAALTELPNSSIEDGMLVRLAAYRPDEVMVRHPSGGAVFLSPPDGIVADLLGDAGSTGDRLHPDDATSVIDAFQSAAADRGTPFQVSARFRVDDGGTWTTLHLTIVDPPDRDELGGAVVTVRALHLAREEPVSVVELLPFPALLIGHHRQLITANSAARRLLLPTDELPVHTWTDHLLDPGVQATVRSALEASEVRPLIAADGRTVGTMSPLGEPDRPGESFLVLLWGLAMDSSELPTATGDHAGRK